jgi:hypothetical protein
MPVSSSGIGKNFTTETKILWISLATNLVCITIGSPVSAAEAKHVEGLHKLCLAELAFVSICRVHIASDSVGVSCLRIGKYIPTETYIRRIVFTSHNMRVPQGFAVCIEASHHAKGVQEFL